MVVSGIGDGTVTGAAPCESDDLRKIRAGATGIDPLGSRGLTAHLPDSACKRGKCADG
jgi:hypothetical protein